MWELQKCSPGIEVHKKCLQIHRVHPKPDVCVCVDSMNMWVYRWLQLSLVYSMPLRSVCVCVCMDCACVRLSFFVYYCEMVLLFFWFFVRNSQHTRSINKWNLFFFSSIYWLQPHVSVYRYFRLDLTSFCIESHTDLFQTIKEKQKNKKWYEMRRNGMNRKDINMSVVGVQFIWIHLRIVLFQFYLHSDEHAHTRSKRERANLYSVIVVCVLVCFLYYSILGKLTISTKCTCLTDECATDGYLRWWTKCCQNGHFANGGPYRSRVISTRIRWQTKRQHCVERCDWVKSIVPFRMASRKRL